MVWDNLQVPIFLIRDLKFQKTCFASIVLFLIISSKATSFSACSLFSFFSSAFSIRKFSNSSLTSEVEDDTKLSSNIRKAKNKNKTFGCFLHLFYNHKITTSFIIFRNMNLLIISFLLWTLSFRMIALPFCFALFCNQRFSHIISINL